MRLILTAIALTALTAAGLMAPMMMSARAHAADLSDHIDVILPAGADGPVPAVVLFAGCGGVRQIQYDYAATANEAGWAAVIVDSFKARGIGRLGARLTVCTALRLRGAERAGDVFAALDYVRADPRFDADRLALAGWSHGGWTILDAMALAEAGEAAPLTGVRQAFLVYPYCGFLSRADTQPIGSILVTMTVVGRDRVVSEQACRRLAEDRRAEGSQIALIYEPELTHAFDAPDQAADPRMRYDAEGSQRSHLRFAETLTALSRR
jgi:dienelactone hydrolase